MIIAEIIRPSVIFSQRRIRLLLVNFITNITNNNNDS